MSSLAPLPMQIPTGDGFPTEIFLAIVLIVVVLALGARRTRSW